MRCSQITAVPYLWSHAGGPLPVVQRIGNLSLGQVGAEPTTFRPIHDRPQQVIFSIVGLAEYPKLLGQPRIIGSHREPDSSWHHVSVVALIFRYVCWQPAKVGHFC